MLAQEVQLHHEVQRQIEEQAGKEPQEKAKVDAGMNNVMLNVLDPKVKEVWSKMSDVSDETIRN